MNCAAAIAAVRFTIRNPRVLILFINQSVMDCKLTAGAVVWVARGVWVERVVTRSSGRRWLAAWRQSR